MDDAERKELAERWKAICEKHKSYPKWTIREYDVWIKGDPYADGYYLGSYWAKTFEEACAEAIEAYFADEDIDKYYNREKNTFRNCSFFEADPPKTYEELVEENEELKKRNSELFEEICNLPDIRDFDFPEFPGFRVYTRETIEQVDPFTLDELKDKAITGNLYLSQNGELVCDGMFGNQVFPLDEYKYIIQIGGVFYRC